MNVLDGDFGVGHVWFGCEMFVRLVLGKDRSHSNGLTYVVSVDNNESLSVVFFVNSLHQLSQPSISDFTQSTYITLTPLLISFPKEVRGLRFPIQTMVPSRALEMQELTLYRRSRKTRRTIRVIPPLGPRP